jgi:hypothetical protein
MSQVSSQQADLAAALGRLEEDNRTLNQSIIKLINQRNPDTDTKTQSTINSIWSSAWMKRQAQREVEDLLSDPEDIRLRDKMLKDESDEKYSANAIRNSLRFEGIASREIAIPEAYKTTFQWIFEEPRVAAKRPATWANFSQWLRGSSTEVYWITGKPGAGKSTLMRFLTSHKTTRSHLLEWSQGNRLLIARFYFWNAGTPLQKSKIGLLRTLLLQCLEQMPHLIPLVCPRRWAMFSIFGSNIYEDLPEWSWAELIESFSVLQSYAGESFNLALFIDGLDEFDGGHQRLLDFVKLFHSRPRVKICVSSRPENIFLDAFACNPSLKMEDFTNCDITAFVNGQFESTPGFQDLCKVRPAEAKKLLDGVITKARGVFLWVSVVVLTLCEGLTEGDKLSELQAVLDRLPSDLSQLYSSIWASIKPAYIQHSSQLFQIHQASTQILDVVVLSLADDENALDQDINDISPADRALITRTMKRRLNSRTRGLLEVSQDGSVDFLHRTVRDWTSTVWNDIVSRAPDFDAHLALLKALTVESSHTDLWKNSRLGLPTQFWTRVFTCFYHASLVHDDLSTASFLAKVLDRLDTDLALVSTSYTISGSLALYRDTSSPTIQLRANNNNLPHWASTQSTKTPGRLDTNFLGLAAQFAVLPYVRHKVTKNRELLRPDFVHVSILSCATLGFEQFCRPDIMDLAAHFTQAIDPAVRLTLVRFLLDNGALSMRPKNKAQARTWAGEHDTFSMIGRKIEILSSIHDVDRREIHYWRSVGILFEEYFKKVEGKSEKSSLKLFTNILMRRSKS